LIQLDSYLSVDSAPRDKPLPLFAGTAHDRIMSTVLRSNRKSTEKLGMKKPKYN
jgi:hypothetical protein